MKIAAAYIRVSTEDQVEYSPDSQLTEIRKYAKAHDMTVPDDLIFVDEGISGKNTKKRPAFNAMIGAAKSNPRPFDAILLWKFSRFARNRQDSIVYKSMLRRELGIEVISISEPIGDDKMSILFEAMIEAMDEYYSINLAEEVRRGMTQRAKEGGYNTYAPFGYRLENHKFIPNPETAPLVQKIFHDFLAGTTIQSLTHQINDLGIRTRFGNRFDRRNIEYILKNPVYIGKVRWTPTGKVRRHHESKDTIITDGTHEPLIAEDVFAAAQAKLEQQRLTYGRYHRVDGKPFMLKGIVKCSCCGSTLVPAFGGKSLQCHNYTKGKCPISHSITVTSLTTSVLNQITHDFEAMDFAILSANGKCVRNDADREIINRQIEREKLKLVRVREAFEAGIDTLEEYRINKKRIQDQITRLEQSRPKPQEVISTAEFVRLHAADLEKLKRDDVPEEEKNNIIRSFVQKIIFNRKNSSFSILYHAT